MKKVTKHFEPHICGCVMCALSCCCCTHLTTYLSVFCIVVNIQDKVLLKKNHRVDQLEWINILNDDDNSDNDYKRLLYCMNLCVVPVLSPSWELLAHKVWNIHLKLLEHTKKTSLETK